MMDSQTPLSCLGRGVIVANKSNSLGVSSQGLRLKRANLPLQLQSPCNYWASHSLDLPLSLPISHALHHA